MKLEIGKLYKLNFDRILSNISGSQYYARSQSICLLLDFNPRKNSAFFNKFKILTEDGIIGWIVTNISAQMLSPQTLNE